MGYASAIATILGKGLKGFKFGLLRVWGMVSDKYVRKVVIIGLFFSNAISNMVAAVTQADGGMFIAALASLGSTIGGSITQLTSGLSLLLASEPGFWMKAKALWIVLLGASTIYWYYQGNNLFIQFVSSTDPDLTHYVYMSLLFITLVMLFHDQSQLFELYDLGSEALSQTADMATDVGTPRDIGVELFGNSTEANP